MLPRWVLGSSKTPRWSSKAAARDPRWSGNWGPWPQAPGRAWARPSSHGFTSDPVKDHQSWSTSYFSLEKWSNVQYVWVLGSQLKSKGPYLQYVPRELLCALLFCWEWEWEEDSLPLELFAAWLACLCGCWESGFPFFKFIYINHPHVIPVCFSSTSFADFETKFWSDVPLGSGCALVPTFNCSQDKYAFSDLVWTIVNECEDSRLTFFAWKHRR